MNSCPAGGPDSIISMLDPAGNEITEVDDGRGLCATESGTVNPDLRNLAAGRYTVCIRTFNTMATPGRPTEAPRRREEASSTSRGESVSHAIVSPRFLLIVSDRS